MVGRRLAGVVAAPWIVHVPAYLQKLTDVPVDLKRSAIVPHGRAAGLMALELAMNAVRADASATVIVGGFISKAEDATEATRKIRRAIDTGANNSVFSRMFGLATGRNSVREMLNGRGLQEAIVTLEQAPHEILGVTQQFAQAASAAARGSPARTRPARGSSRSRSRRPR